MLKNKDTLITDDPSRAASVLKKGGIVLFPTETVYGLGANSRNFQACLEIYKIKNRPADNPLIVHLSDPGEIPKIASMNAFARSLAAYCMPGPITFVLSKLDNSVFSTGLSTLAVRVPSHSTANEMLRAFGGPVSAPSANLSGQPSITRFSDAVSEFKGKVDLILKGPEPTIGLESTVIDLSGPKPRILRPGFWSFEDLKDLLPELEDFGPADTSSDEEKPMSPGTKYRHYAPDAIVFLAEEGVRPEADAAAIGIGLLPGWKYGLDLKDNAEYMRNLYSFFRDCDRQGITKIYCFPPLEGKGKEALLNRIQKAQDSGLA
ncbi:threonylcarbamoyl-AMP synthase [Leptospira langatensis]|uniref:Threonylcarbamoyl-AMP synthase n=1 Tax=Leptospira langatensis TaxID=2484983 RepID=A0A5F2A072_9LEPT|nr:L-threonylcarbamoyladenylate synthase [Leptospira langatensis]TGK04149.1 threonylcarbamoyl-AMP synthase [Leptospira langatensis]TGL43629.1 threonylcarbamoyl-AMP synthase [Leptospira langatensis]